MFRQKGQAARQCSSFVPRGKHQAGFARHPRVKRPGLPRDDDHPCDVPFFILDSPAQHRQSVHPRRLFAGDGPLRRVSVGLDLRHGQGRVLVALRTALLERREHLLALEQRDGVRVDAADGANGGPRKSDEAVHDGVGLFTDEVTEFIVSGDAPSFIDMPPLCTHDITNTGDSELVTLFWSHDHFDPNNADTWPLPVVGEGLPA